MLSVTEDKLRFLQSLITHIAFNKNYQLNKNTQILFRAPSQSDINLINSETTIPNTQLKTTTASIASITINGETYKYLPISNLEFNNDQYLTPLPQLIQHITQIFENNNINWESVINIYYTQFLPLTQQLTQLFNNLNFLRTDPVITAVLDLVYNNVVDLRILNLNNVWDRNYLAILLNYSLKLTQEPNMRDKKDVKAEVKTTVEKNAKELIQKYNEMVAKKNAKRK